MHEAMDAAVASKFTSDRLTPHFQDELSRAFAV